MSGETVERHADELRNTGRAREDTGRRTTPQTARPDCVNSRGVPGLTTESHSEAERMMHHKSDPWRAEVRRQAYVAVKIAATRREASDRTLGYMLRKAMSHGLTIDEVCQAGDLDAATVMRLTDPAVAA